MRRCLLPLMLLVLGGCANAVTSTTPLLDEADSRGGAPLRQGVWRMETPGACSVREKRRIDQWPDCARSFVVRDGDILQFIQGRDASGRPVGAGSWVSAPFIFSARDPRIIQEEMEKSVMGQSAVPIQAGVLGTSDGPRFAYLVVKNRDVDGRGRIVEIETPPTEGASAASTDNADPRATTAIVPLTGLTMNDDGIGCIAGSKASLVNAAGATLANATLTKAHWVRDGWR